MPDPPEFFDQEYGFILYRTRLSGPRPEALLVAHEVRDRAQVLVDSRAIGVLERETGDEALSLEIPLQDVTLDLLVENMGRANFGPGLADRKGIAGSVAWVNGFNLGRCWQRGPQHTPDVPAPISKPGLNEIIVFELHGAERLTVELRDKPELG
jgi:beta-galactosidase